MIGRSGSPSSKATITSWPTRGIQTPPHCLPDHAVPTRTQQELPASFLPSRSQKNCTFTRPYLSVKISWPDGPTTTAVWGPGILGLGVASGGRYGKADGMQRKVERYASSGGAVSV